MNFAETKKEIFDQSKAGGKRTFSEATFNKLTSAMANEVNYEVQVRKGVQDGKAVVETIKPVQEFRKKVIGGIAAQAGVDKDETEKLISEFKFSADTPWYPIVSESITNMMESGKSFASLPKADMNATFTMEDVPETIKMNGAPGAPESEKKPVVYAAHRRIKCNSTCPKYLRKG